MTAENWIIVGLGLGTVFVGLICIIVLCSIVSLIIRKTTSQVQDSTPNATNAVSQEIPNRQEVIAAVSAALAEELGKDVSAIRILSFKKI